MQRCSVGQWFKSCHLRLICRADSASLLTRKAAQIGGYPAWGTSEVEKGTHIGSHVSLPQGGPSYIPGEAVSSGIKFIRLLEKNSRVKL